MNNQQAINQVCSEIETVIVNLNAIVDRVNSLNIKVNALESQLDASKSIFEHNLTIVKGLQDRIIDLENASKG
jgi:tetrahydromethanopterin S-methyltransferase subunit B